MSVECLIPHVLCLLPHQCGGADARAGAGAGAAIAAGAADREGIGMSASRHVLVRRREGEILLQAQDGGHAVSTQEAVVPEPGVRDI